MGCNCKSKPQERLTPTTLKEQAIKENKQIALDVVLEMETALAEYSTNLEQRIKLQKFFHNSWGELIPEYCDLICQKRIKNRLEKLKTDTLNE
jgi:hypothetical protein